MKIIVAHNRYKIGGGEDSVVNSEVELLRNHGNEVLEYRRDNSEVDGLSKLELAKETVWSNRTHKGITGLIESFAPDVVHVHNTFPLISPSIYWACERAGVPVVQTLHNFRLLCPQAMFLRDGKICEDCIGKVPWRGALHGCYRESRVQSAMVAGTVSIHNIAGTWRNKVSRYIALNEFCKRKFIQGGLPADRISVKPNFVDIDRFDPGARSGFLYVGRLSVEKGVDVLLRALNQSGTSTLRIAGGHEVDGFAGIGDRAKFLGSLGQAEVYGEMRRATALIIPSIWYENFPRTLVEAFANGLPVIVSRIGALAELVEDGVTGLLFEPGNDRELADRLDWAASHPIEMARMGAAARELYERKFASARNYEILMDIYQSLTSEVVAA